MAATVSIKELIDALEMQFDESKHFVGLDTGHVETVPTEYLHMAEDEPDPFRKLPDWEAELLAAERIVSTERFVRLPDQFEVDEWSLMQDFSREVQSKKISDELLHAIHGRGAFRMFKDAIRRHKIEDDWYAFRTEALRKVAVEWCEENKIAWR